MVPLIIGVDGVIGSALWNYFRNRGQPVFGTSRRNTELFPYLDITKPDIEALELDKITHAIIAAANPNIRQCELDPDSTRACNLTGPLELASQFERRGIQPILFSSDYIFDGVRGGYSEEEAPSPLNEYGRQKAQLERMAPILCPNSLIIRLTKVYSGLLSEITFKFLHKEKIRAAIDQVFSPIFISDICHALDSLMQKKAKGLYNLAGPEVWSRYELALEIARYLEMDPALIEPISLDDLDEPFKRPKKTDLRTDKLKSIIHLKSTHLNEALLSR